MNKTKVALIRCDTYADVKVLKAGFLCSQNPAKE